MATLNESSDDSNSHMHVPVPEHNSPEPSRQPGQRQQHPQRVQEQQDPSFFSTPTRPQVGQTQSASAHAEDTHEIGTERSRDSTSSGFQHVAHEDLEGRDNTISLTVQIQNLAQLIASITVANQKLHDQMDVLAANGQILEKKHLDEKENTQGKLESLENRLDRSSADQQNSFLSQDKSKHVAPPKEQTYAYFVNKFANQFPSFNA